MGEIAVDPVEFDAWVEGLEKGDLLHAFRALKILELAKFKQTVGEDITEVIEQWSQFK